MNLPVALTAQILLHQYRTVDRSAIPDDQHLPQMPDKVFQEADTILTLDGVISHLHQQAPIIAQSTDDRQMLTAQR